MLIYLFIEAACPTKDMGLSEKQKKELILSLVDKTIPARPLYLFFTQLFDTKKRFPPPVDLDQSTIDTLRKELERLYPYIYEKSCKTKGHFAKELADWERTKLAK